MWILYEVGLSIILVNVFDDDEHKDNSHGELMLMCKLYENWCIDCLSYAYWCWNYSIKYLSRLGHVWMGLGRDKDCWNVIKTTIFRKLADVNRSTSYLNWLITWNFGKIWKIKPWQSINPLNQSTALSENVKNRKNS